MQGEMFMRNDSVMPVLIVSLVFGAFVYFDTNRKIEELKTNVINLQINASQREVVKNGQIYTIPSQGFYNGR